MELLMHIMLVSTGLGLGGAERQVADLADRFVQRGHRVTLVCLTGEVVVRPKDGGIPVYHLGMTKTPISFMKSFARMVRLIRQLKPEVIHAHMVHANLFTRLARLVVDIPVLISTAHSRNEGGKHRMWAYRATNRLCDVFTNVGSVAVDAFVESGAAPAGEIRSVANGIDSEQFYPDSLVYRERRSEAGIPDTRQIFLAVGRFVEAKDYPNLLSAFDVVHAQHPHCELWIAGGGPLFEEMKALMEQKGMQAFVRLLGVRSDIPDLMRMANVYVLSSRWEGMPLVVGEAMSSGLPVVATDCGGVLEYLGDSRFLAPAGDAEALANRLIEAAAMSREELLEEGLRSRERIVAHFSLDAVVDQWLEIYRSVKGGAIKGSR